MNEREDRRRHIHIIPLGYEIDRIVRPVLNEKDLVEKVFVLRLPDDQETAIGFLENIKDQFTENGVKYEEETCDLFDFNDTLAAFSTIIARHDSKEVLFRINAST